MLVKCFASLVPRVAYKEVNRSTLPKLGSSKSILFSWNFATTHADRLIQERELLKPQVFDLLSKLSSNKGHFAPTCKLRPLPGSDRCTLRVLKGTFQSFNGSGSCSL